MREISSWSASSHATESHRVLFTIRRDVASQKTWVFGKVAQIAEKLSAVYRMRRFAGRFPILSHTHPVYILQSNLCTICFNIIPSSTLRRSFPLCIIVSQPRVNWGPAWHSFLVQQWSVLIVISKLFVTSFFFLRALRPDCGLNLFFF